MRLGLLIEQIHWIDKLSKEICGETIQSRPKQKDGELAIKKTAMIMKKNKKDSLHNIFTEQ